MLSPGDLAGSVHVIPVRLYAGADVVEAARGVLSPEERARSDRFRGETLQSRYVLGRACLRVLLAELTRVSPSEIRLGYGAAGKPALEWPVLGPAFNLSHCGDMAVYAITKDAEIGVDLERVREMEDRDAVAQRFFSPAECAALQGYPLESREAAFFRCWVRKEAYLKALGDGLSAELDSFRVSLGEPAELLESARGDVAKWTMQGFGVRDGYEGAVVYWGRPQRLVVHDTRDAEGLASQTAA